MTVLQNSGLETDTYGAPGWNHLYNRNMDLLENNLLKLRALMDVDMSNIADQSPFKWNATSLKWEAVRNE